MSLVKTDVEDKKGIHKALPFTVLNVFKPREVVGEFSSLRSLLKIFLTEVCSCLISEMQNSTNIEPEFS